MTPTNLADQLIRDEGLKLKPYKDTVGKLTIGVGRNLDDVGISEAEARDLLGNDIGRVCDSLGDVLPWLANLDEVRRAVLYNMAFNMGVGGLLKFRTTLGLVQSGNYRAASEAMLDSIWAKQVGDRATRLSMQLATGEWQ